MRGSLADDPTEAAMRLAALKHDGVRFDGDRIVPGVLKELHSSQRGVRPRVVSTCRPVRSGQ